MSRSPSSYLVDEFEYLWRTGKEAVACAFARQNFKQLPDPSPLRLTIAAILLSHDRPAQAQEVYTKTIEHFLYSGFFFRAVAAYVPLRLINKTSEIPSLMYQLYGPESEYVRADRVIPTFPEPEVIDLIQAATISPTEFDEATEEELLDTLYLIATDPYQLKQSPGFVSSLPIFNELSEETYLQIMKLIDVQKYESTQLVDKVVGGELTWTVGEDTFIQHDSQVTRLKSGTLLGLDYYYSIPTTPHEIVANHSPLLRLPPMALLVIQSTWENLYDDLTKLAFSSVIEDRLVSHKIVESVPESSRKKLLSQLNIRVIEQGNIVGISNTENLLGGDSSTSSFFIILAGSVAVEALDLDDGQERETPVSCHLKAPCIVGAFDFFLEQLPMMVFRSTSNIVSAELSAANVQEWVVEYPEIGKLFSDAATKTLKKLHQAAKG